MTPVDYDQPIPDTRDLARDVFTRETAMVGIDLQPARMLDLLRDLSATYRSEYETLPLRPTGSPLDYYIDNQGFESVDGEMLYCLIRRLRPRRMIEIGSGFSTLLAAKALIRNERDGAPMCEYTVIDAYPRAVVGGVIPGVTAFRAEPVQGVPLDLFMTLGPDDILFIDSSHVLRLGSDVQFEYLEVLPRLRAGVWVHLHDIFLPRDYPRSWVMKEHRFWTEQYLLQAFLCYNADYEVMWAGSYMHLNHPEELRSAFASYGPERWPGSFWIRRRDPGAQREES
ncbi:MAG: class I SAM-dependent methyltransferase [Candidatus Limnocylindrales bacterium]